MPLPKLLTALGLLALSPSSSLADTSQVPAGVRAFVYRHVIADVPDSFDNSGSLKDFSVKETLGTSVIKSISSDVSSAYDELHKVSPALAESIDLGKIDLNPDIDVKANAFALVWGLSDRLMLAGAIPLMSAKVSLSGGYYNTGAIKSAATQLKAISDPGVKEKANAFAQVLEQLPVIRGEHLQGVIVNEFGYKPIGNWEASGVGDAQLFTQYKTIDGDVFKNAMRLGVELPTGRTDDPDNLLDIPFGTGYTKSYLEAQNDVFIFGEKLMWNLMGRYQYHWSADRTFRLSPSTTFPLTSQKETINYKPGNAWTIGTELSTKLWKSVGAGAGIYRKVKNRDSIRGARQDYNYDILEDRTDSQTDTAEVFVSYSTVDLFLRKKFPVPFKIGMGLGRVISGRNTERVNTTNLNFEMYF